MADNLKLQQEINKLVAERNKMLEEGELLIQRQSKLYATLLEVMSGKKGAEAIEEVIQKMDAARNAMSQMAQAAQDAAQKTGQSFDVTGEDVDRLFEKTRSFSEMMKTKFPKSFAVAAAAASGLGQGFRNIVALGKGLFGVVSSIAKGIWELGKSIMAIPFKLFGSLIDMAQSGAGGNELMEAYENVRKEFGSFKEDVAQNVIGAYKSMQGELGNTGLSVWRVLGNMADRLKYVTELAKGLGPTMHVLGAEFSRSAEDIVIYQKGLGIATEDMKALGERAIATGQPLTEQMHEIANMSLQMGKSFGLSSKMISRDISKMVKDVKNFGSLSVKEMTEMAVYTKKLGVEFTKLQGLIDKFDTFEDAATSAAKLSQAFGVNINAFEMMKKQSPAERLDELRKAFTAAGKSAENLSRQEYKLIEDATGLDAETAKLALSSKNAGLSMDDIKKKSDAAQKKQLTQAEVTNKLADAIERLVQMGDSKHKGFFEAFFSGIERGIQASPEFYRLMMNIRFAMLQVKMIGVELGRFLVKAFPGAQEMAKNLADMFDPGKFKKLFGKISETVKKFIDPAEGELPMTFEKAYEAIKKGFFDFFNAEKGPGKKVLDGMKKFTMFVIKVSAEALKFAVSKLKDTLVSATQFLRDPSAFFEGLKKGKSAGKDLFFEMFDPLIKVLTDKSMWTDLWAALKVFAGEFWKKAKDLLFAAAEAVPPGVWLSLAGVFIGPMVGRTLAAVGGIVLTESLRKMFFSTAEKAPDLAEAAARAASVGGSTISKFLGPIIGNPYVAAAAVTAALAVVGSAMAAGVEKYKEHVEKVVGKGDEATFGAASAGIIQTLSFGTISDKAAGAIAVNMAKIAKTATDKAEEIFGPVFAGDLKEIFFSSMRSVIDLGDILRSLFKGDVPGILSALGSLTANLFRLIISAFKFVFVSLPAKLFDLVFDLSSSLGDMLGSVFSDTGDSPMTGKIYRSIDEWIMSFGKYLADGLEYVLRIAFIKFPVAMTKLFAGMYSFVFGALGALVDWAAKYFKSQWLQDAADLIKDFAAFLSYIGKFMSEAFTKIWEQIKNAVSGKETHFEETFLALDMQKGFEQYKKGLKKQAQDAVQAKNDAAKEVAAAPTAVTLPKPPPEKQDAGSFLHEASRTMEDVENLKKSLATIKEEDLQKMKSSFSKVVSVFGDDKDLSANVEKVKNISQAFNAISEIVASAAAFKQNYAKVGDIQVQLEGIKSTISSAVAIKFPEISDATLTQLSSAKRQFSELADIAEASKSIARLVTTGGIDKSFQAVVDMVAKVQKMNESITKMTEKPFEIKARLQELATRLGMGANQTYSIKNNGIEIKIDLNVTMDAGKVEEVIIRRSDSKIRKTFTETSGKDANFINRNLGTQY